MKGDEPVTAAPARDDIVGRARDMAPALRARAAEAERLRRIPEATVRELHENGLWRVLRPARYGGWETDYGVLLDVAAELARGCASTAWVYANLASHNWMLPMWPEGAAAEVWGENPDALIGSALIYPPGRVEPVAGGYRLGGRWPYSSGIDASDWVMLGGMDPELGDNGAPGPRMFVVRVADIDIIDTWHVAGLAATGSKDVACENLFVPAHMTLPVRETRGGPKDGPNGGIVGEATGRPAAPAYRLPVLALFPHLLAAPMLGIAQGAYEDFVESLRTQVSTYNASRVAGHTTVQLKIAEAGVLIESARLLLRENWMEAHRIVEGSGDENGTPDLRARMRWRRDAAQAARNSLRAVDLIYEACGGRANYRDNILHRRFADIHAAAAQIQVVWDINGPEFGRVELGLPPENPNV